MFENRRWVIIPKSLVDTINFSEIVDNNKESLRYSIDGSKTFVKYDIRIVETDEINNYYNPETMQNEQSIIKAGVYGRPSFYTTDLIEYTHSEILQILDSSEWINDKLNLENNY